jgi:peptide/nickel transport system permease protein
MRLWLPAGILSLWAALAVVGPWLPLHPDRIELAQVLSPPPAAAWLGYDDLGRPVLDRLVTGARISCLVSVGVVAISLAVGAVLGSLCAYAGGLWDHLLARAIDVFLAFPGILLAIMLAGLLGPGIDNVIFALAAVGWVGFARLTRAQVLSVKHRDHVQAAIALGSTRLRVVARHLLPLVSAPLIVEATFGMASVVIAEAGLSFLGLGVQPPQASWGSMIRDGARYMLVAPHVVLAAGTALLLVVLSANLLGDWLRDRMDVRTEGRG